MKRELSILLFFIFSISLQAQKDSLNTSSGTVLKRTVNDISNISISIFPVPVRENRFTIRCNTDILSVKITNIIGQDIYRAQYKEPQQVIDIHLPDNHKRGMYLVTLVFNDGRRIVKKILMEEST